MGLVQIHKLLKLLFYLIIKILCEMGEFSMSNLEGNIREQVKNEFLNETDRHAL